MSCSARCARESLSAFFCSQNATLNDLLLPLHAVSLLLFTDDGFSVEHGFPIIKKERKEKKVVLNDVLGKMHIINVTNNGIITHRDNAINSET